MAAGWRITSKRWGSKDVRAMWGPFLSQQACIVEGRVSAHMLAEDFAESVPAELRAQAVELSPYIGRHLDAGEPAGLMGKGDHEAIVRVQAGLARAGLDQTLSVRSDDELGERRKDNLIVIGGPDVNQITEELLTLLNCGVTIARTNSSRNVVQDVINGPRYNTTSEAQETTDYGILVKGPSPYQQGKQVVIIAGAYGYGCLAASDFAINAKERMAELSRAHPRGFEGIVSYRRSGETSRPTEIIDEVLFRKLRGTT